MNTTGANYAANVSHKPANPTEDCQIKKDQTLLFRERYLIKLGFKYISGIQKLT